MSVYDEAMGEIVNLRRIKKARAKAEADRQTAANRARHGRTLAERDAADTERTRQARTLDGAALDPDEA